MGALSFTKQEPWKVVNSYRVIYHVGEEDGRLDIPNNMDPDIANIIRQCWKKQDFAYMKINPAILLAMFDLIYLFSYSILNYHLIHVNCEMKTPFTSLFEHKT